MIISVTDLKSNKSTESWNFQLNNSEGKNAKLIVKGNGKILQENKDFTLKFRYRDSQKCDLAYEVTPIPITRNLKVFRNGEYYFGFYGKSRIHYLCLENNKWKRYIWCNEKNTETEKKN